MPRKGLILAVALWVVSGCASQSVRLTALLAHSSSPAEPGSTVAVSVIDLSSGARSSFHGDLRLPMMSVFKVPLAVLALDAVDGGQMSLTQPIPLAENELIPNTGLAEAWKAGEHAPRLDVVITKMIQESDNTAGDKILSVLGGASGVRVRLRALSVHGIDIGEPEINISGRLRCAGAPVPAGGWTAAAIDKCPEPNETERVAAAQREIANSPNAASTDALVEFLARLDAGTLLSKFSQRWLLNVMTGTLGGTNRIKGLLPAGTAVAHKPGTGGMLPGLFVATNDLGIVTAPNGKRFAIGVFVVGSRQPMREQEQVIAKLGRAAWDTITQ